MLDVVRDVDLATRFSGVYIGVAVAEALVALNAADPTLTTVLAIGVRAVVFTAAAVVRIIGQVCFTTRLLVLAVDVAIRALIDDARADFAVGELGVRRSTGLIAATTMARAAVRVGFTTILRQLIAVTTAHGAG